MSLFPRDHFKTYRLPAARFLLVAVIVLCFGTVASSQAAAPAAYGQGQDVYTTASGMAISGHVLYMTWPSDTKADRRLIVSIDISHPEKPVLLDSLQFDGYPQGLAVVGSHVLMVNGLNLYVIDAKNPADLRLAGGLELTRDPLDGPVAIQVKGKTAYLACRRAGIAEIDISNIGRPRLATRLALPGVARDVTSIGDDLLYVASDTYGVQVVKINQAQGKTQLKNITRLKAAKGSPARLVQQGRVVYAAAGSVLLGDISLTDPQNPKWMAMTSDRGLYNPYYGSYAHDLAIVQDASNSAKPKTYVLVADGEAGLSVVDVTNPLALAYLPSPVTRSSSNQTILAMGVRTLGKVAYVVDQNFGLRCFDITDLSSPTSLGDGLDLTSLSKDTSQK